MTVIEAYDADYLPVPGNVLPRFAGVPTFMRLRSVPPSDADAIEIGFVGIPFDGATSNRPGARHGPRQLRDLSTMIRLVNQATRIAPFHLARCADLGDAPVNPVSVESTAERLEGFYRELRSKGVLPISAGGDHYVSLPILRSLVGDGGPIGMVHVDAHSDLYPPYFGGFDSHGTPFRRAIEEGLLDPKRVVQIGLRGTSIDMSDIAFGEAHGVRMIMIEEFRELGVERVMAEARAVVGDGPTYVSFDIDAIDPSQAPGTGTPEVGGIFVHEAQAMLRRLVGLDVVGADLVEVSPPFDQTGNTAWVGANLMFELACVMADKVRRTR